MLLLSTSIAEGEAPPPPPTAEKLFPPPQPQDGDKQGQPRRSPPLAPVAPPPPPIAVPPTPVAAPPPSRSDASSSLQASLAAFTAAPIFLIMAAAA
ncbi:hypothetical protein ABZP36_019892 [Zizania latifolia]